MSRQIISADIQKVKTVLQTVLGNAQYRSLARLGGLTNHTYQVVLMDGQEYVVRIPGDGTEELIDREAERVSTKCGGTWNRCSAAVLR